MIQRLSFWVAFGLIVLGRWFVSTQALSSSSSSFITLKDPLDGGIEQLPASYVATWATWVYDYDTTWYQIPSQDGFVSPTTFDELWQPVDLKYPDMQLALGVHVRNGQIRHVFPAVDLFYTPQRLHRNRGHCTLPRATEWTNFRLGVGGIESWVMTFHNNDPNNEDQDESKQKSWSIPIASTLSRILEGLATDPPTALATGSHIIHVPLVEQENDNDDFWTCPSVGQRLQVSLGSPLSIHTDNNAPGLDLAVVAAAAGSQSDYLPNAYRPLYENVAFRRPEYQALRQKLDTNHIYKELLDQERKQQ